MESTRPLVCLAVLTAITLAGCKDDDDEGIPIYVSGVNADDRKVSELDEDEKRQVCRSYDGYINATVGFEQIVYAACLPLAIVFGGTRDGCEARLQDCMQLAPSPVNIQARVQNEGTCFDYLDRCNLSVGQLEGCINLNFAGIIRVLENFSCAGAADERQRNAAQDLMQTANACVDANAVCREFTSAPEVL